MTALEQYIERQEPRLRREMQKNVDLELKMKRLIVLRAKSDDKRERSKLRKDINSLRLKVGRQPLSLRG